MNEQTPLQPDRLPEAMQEVENQIRRDPARPKHRIYLFQLLAILGRWERALNQLNVLEDLDSSVTPMVIAYRQAIHCETLRAEIFAGQRSPVIFGEPEEWTALLLESLRLTARQQHAQAEAMRAQALEFAWIADADSRLGPILEVIINGRYAWVPFQRIRSIEIEPPSDLRDLVWMPAHFTWANGGELVGLIPTRYPGTEAAEDGQLLLSRRTEWVEAASETFLGRGQRVLTTDEGEYALLDVRAVELAPPPQGEASGDA
jgi:type VI secretion system protein ImpE